MYLLGGVGDAVVAAQGTADQVLQAHMGGRGEGDLFDLVSESVEGAEKGQE